MKNLQMRVIEKFEKADVKKGNLSLPILIKISQIILDDPEILKVANAFIENAMSDYLLLDEKEYRMSEYGGLSTAWARYSLVVDPDAETLEEGVDWYNGFSIYYTLREVGKNHYKGLEEVLEVIDSRE